MDPAKPLETAPSPLRHSLLAARLLAFLTLLTLAACSPRREYGAALLLSDIAAGAAPTRLKSTTPPPRRSEVTLPSAGGGMAADLYLPGELKPLAGLLLIPGAAEKGKDDPRLQALANSMARARFAVLVPDLATLRSLQLSSSDIGNIADAFTWLVSRSDLAPQGRAGIFSFSYASGPAILAALEPQVAGRVRFIMAVGGYHSVRSVLTFFTTGYYQEKGQWRHREPNSYGKWVFVRSNVARLPDPNDRLLVQQMARRKMDDLNAPIRDLAARLSPEGKSVYDFVENRDPAKAIPLMNRLPATILREIEALDVAGHDLSLLKAQLILVHGYDDDIIPYTESVALAASVPAGQACLYLVYGLHHVDLEPRMIDKYRLWRAMAALLRERDGG